MSTSRRVPATPALPARLLASPSAGLLALPRPRPPTCRRALLQTRLLGPLRAGLLAACALTAGVALAQAPQPVPPGAATTEVAGVRLASAVDVGGVRLPLNGAGLRTRFVVRVYVAGLYLAEKADSPEAVFDVAGPKRLHVVMLRDVDANELGRLFTRGMQDNSARETFSRVVPGTLRIGEIFAQHKRLKAGDHFSVDWVPGSGTQVLVNGQPQGDPIREPEFFNAMLGIWLGPKPADAMLKDALLGKAPPAQAGMNN